MGVVAKDKEPSFKTSELSDWIYKVKIKKLNCKRQRRKNLFIEAVLSNALSRAEVELRHKQQERKLKWEHIKSKWFIDKDYIKNDKPRPIIWDTSTCEDLNSLDNFMSQLKEVKVSLER